MAAAAQGVVNAATQQPVPAQIAIANANTVPYTPERRILAGPRGL
ncbi:hypothetical protein EC990839_2507, partial [Escherichia coli 99.0839]